MNITRPTTENVIATSVVKHATPRALLKGTRMCTVKLNCMSVAPVVNLLHSRGNGDNIGSNITELQPSPVTNASNGSCAREN